MRPSLFQVGGVLYWTILTRNPDTGLLKDADSTPTIAVRKNGASVGDSVTITKRTATTGIYDCSYNPAAEAEGDAFTFEESATVTGTTTTQGTYSFSWSARTVRTGVVELDSAALDPVLEAIDNYVSSVVAGAQLAVGTIAGFPTTLAIGDSYTDDCNSAIHVFIRDANDDPVTAVGDHEFTDTDFAPECTITLSGNTGKVKATVTYVDPGASESYLKIQIPSKESRRATPGVATVQVVLKWSDSGAQKTLSSQAVTWTNQL